VFGVTLFMYFGFVLLALLVAHGMTPFQSPSPGWGSRCNCQSIDYPETGRLPAELSDVRTAPVSTYIEP
jgi:hypothetical protein